jgi:hypothetical protein
MPSRRAVLTRPTVTRLLQVILGLDLGTTTIVRSVLLPSVSFTRMQQLWVRDEEGCQRLTFWKGQKSSVIYRGNLISAEVPKSKQTKQVVCLRCIDMLLSNIVESADGLSITVRSRSLTVRSRRDGGPDAAILQRHGAGTFWTQILELTKELISILTSQNESTVMQKKLHLNAAQQAINKGAAKGERARTEGVPGTTVSCHRVP